MIRSGRLSVALHVLLHMAEHPDEAMTSEQMAACAGTNPVVIRRTFAGLREAGVVSSVKGHGGGWRIARPLEAVNLAEIQDAVGERLVALTPDDASPCLVAGAVNRALGGAVEEARRLLDARLETITLADIARDIARTGGRVFMHSKSGGRHDP